ncbi:MAG: glycosyltransferase family 39 protein, partial [Planctomycetota bacterium]|nr:glycosyltransferase family 39 protein [Planctomycetota bacterium]
METQCTSGGVKQNKVATPKKRYPRDKHAAPSTAAHLALLILLCGGLFLFRIQSLPLADPEEARCALIVRHMLDSGDWIVPHLDGQVYYDKPAPYFWLTAAGWKLTGSAELGGRLVSALAGLLAVMITYAFARRQFSPLSGMLAGVVLATSGEFLFLARWYRMDMPFAAAMWAYLIYASGAGGKALTWLGEKFGVLKDDVLTAYRGIADALAAGDISLAVKVLWLTLKMEWTRGVNFLEKAWLNFRNFFIKIGYDAWHGLLAVVEVVWHALEVGWIETAAFFAKAWYGFVGFFARTWERIKSGAKKAWNWIKSLFDDSVDLEAENKLVEQEKQRAISQIDDEQARKTAEREAKREAERRRAAAVQE